MRSMLFCCGILSVTITAFVYLIPVTTPVKSFASSSNVELIPGQQSKCCPENISICLSSMEKGVQQLHLGENTIIHNGKGGLIHLGNEC